MNYDSNSFSVSFEVYAVCLSACRTFRKRGMHQAGKHFCVSWHCLCRLIFNSRKKKTKQNLRSFPTRNSSLPFKGNRNTSSSILGLKVHAEARIQGLINTLHSLGLVSYDQVLSISCDIANTTCLIFQQDGVVIPPHVITECDTVSFIEGTGKLKAWEAWMAFSAVNQVFLELHIFSIP